MATITLNEAQRTAVEHGDGPLLIIAGAGSGKTRVITHRIARLIEKGTPPEQIVALTFSNKAAAEMAERVETLVGRGYEEMWIGTFHSFCAELLRQYGLAAGVDPFFSILTDAQQHVMMASNLESLELRQFAVKGRPHGLISALLRVISRAKDEMITAEEYVAHAAEERRKLAAMALDGEARAEREKVVGEVEEVARTYQLHEELAAMRGATDFGGLILTTIQMLRDRPDILGRVQGHLRYVLVDEFQDTNFAQSVLVDMLVAKHRNICVVGDDDQSIYRFRGASIKNILDFQSKYADAAVVRLVENYRSGQGVLDAADAVVSKNEARLEKRLVAQHADAVVDAYVAPDADSEAEHIARRITALIDEGVQPGEIAVLLRSVKGQGPPIVKALQRAGIPHDVVDGSMLLDKTEVRDAIAWLRAAANPFDSEAVLRLLTAPPIEMDPVEACRIANFAAERRRAVFEIADTPQRVPNLESEAALLAKRTADAIRGLAKSARRQTAEQVAHEVLARSGYRAYLAGAGRDGLVALANLAQLEKTAGEFAGARGGTLSEFLSYLDIMARAGLRDPSAQLGSGGVQVMTMHAAKGLEFEAVFMAALSQSKIPGSCRPNQIEIPEALLKEQLPEATPRAAHVAEERRLFYVAMTRAKRRLMMSYSRGVSVRGAKASQFLVDALEAGVELREIDGAGANEAVRVEVEVAGEDRDASSLESLRDFLPLRDGGLSLSYSDIDCYLTCPMRFKLGRILRIPSKPAPERSLGTLVHGVLEQFHRVYPPDEADFAKLEEIFERAWTAKRYGTTTQEKQFKQKALTGLRRYIDDYRRQEGVPAFFERDFNLKVGAHWIRGRVDRVDALPDGGHELIDYKVGKVWDDKRVREDLQLSVYHMGAADVWGIRPSVLSYYFILDNRRVSLARADEELALARQTISDAAAGILAERFEPREDYIACQYCDYTLVCPAKDK